MVVYGTATKRLIVVMNRSTILKRFIAHAFQRQPGPDYVRFYQGLEARTSSKASAPRLSGRAAFAG